MGRTRRVGVLFIIMLAAAVSNADAELGFDRVVRPDEFGGPVVVSGVDGRTVGVFAGAAGVPMGIELAPYEVRRNRTALTLTGIDVGKALQLIAGFDQRY